MQQPSSHSLHITFFGRCNSGKSALINAITRQDVSIVSDIAGTTTDPVFKSIELPGIGATVLIDTPGLDDTSILGQQRMAQSIKVIDKTDIALVLFNGTDTAIEEKLITRLNSRHIPIIGVITKCDTLQNSTSLQLAVAHILNTQPIILSATTKDGIDKLIARLATISTQEAPLITHGVCSTGDIVVLVMPQDAQAPKGRIIKPQVEVLRELLDRGCNALCCTPQNLPQLLTNLTTPPQLIITDSQVFAHVNKHKPATTKLTSFSVLFARQKGDIDLFVDGAKTMLTLSSSARILIAEACSHIPQHEDIGRVKLPQLLRQKLGNEIIIDIVGGSDFPQDLTPYDLVIHCGACMFTRRHVISRVEQAKAQNIPMTNYGIAIVALIGILDQVAY